MVVDHPAKSFRFHWVAHIHETRSKEVEEAAAFCPPERLCRVRRHTLSPFSAAAVNAAQTPRSLHPLSRRSCCALSLPTRIRVRGRVLYVLRSAGQWRVSAAFIPVCQRAMTFHLLAMASAKTLVSLCGSKPIRELSLRRH